MGGSEDKLFQVGAYKKDSNFLALLEYNNHIGLLK